MICSERPWGSPRRKIRGSCELRQDFDGRVIWDEEPDFEHVGVRYGNAAIRPVAALIVARIVLQLVGQAVDHDGAAAVPVIAPGVLYVRFVGVRDLHREEEVAAGIAAHEAVGALWRTEVASAFLGTGGVQ